MKAEILKLLLRSHTEGDESAFRRAALQLAAAESAAGHARVADEIRTLIAQLPPTRAHKSPGVVDIAQPRGDLADVLEGGHRDERLRDIVLDDSTRALLVRVMAENRSRARLERFGVQPRRRLLFQGPPGCGKTLAAAVVAGEMGLPLLTVRFDALFSRFLGATGTQLRAVFGEMPRRAGVYLFDEFDAVGKARGDSQDVGEMNRVVTAFLQLMDADSSASIIIAATNHVELLDRAVFRRFDVIVPFAKPTEEQIASLLTLRLHELGLSDGAVRDIASRAVGRSFADLVRAADDAVRSMALDGRERVESADVITAFESMNQRSVATGA